MLKVKTEKGADDKVLIDKALKQFKRKCNNTKLVKELRQRQEYIKPSVIRRTQKINAIYAQAKRREEEI